MVMLSACIQKFSTSVNANLSVLVDAWHQIPLEPILKQCNDASSLCTLYYECTAKDCERQIQYSTVFLSVFFGKAVVFVLFYSISGFSVSTKLLMENQTQEESKKDSDAVKSIRVHGQNILCSL